MATPPKQRTFRKKMASATAATAILALALAGCSGDDGTTTGKSGTDISGSVELFDAEASHTVSLSWNDDDYTAMIADYTAGSDKTWISADITIDGTLIKNVGVRLKGNSTLRTLGGDSGMGGMPGGTDGTMPTDLPTDMAGGGMGGGGMRGGTDGTMPTDMPTDMAGGGMPGGTDGTMPTDLPTDMAGGGMGGGGMGGMTGSSDISADDPSSLPLLIRFDKYVDGTSYDGLTELALRPGTPVINEALALSLTAASDQTTQRYAYTTYSVNGSATTTRLLLENPDENYADAVSDASGDTDNMVLFKADADSSFKYQGDDLATYEDQFKQLNKEDTNDATPIVNFLKWFDESDDATFEAELSDWVDVDSFAKYAATQNLLVNTDDMSGPGQNYYLGYDLTTKKISVISWDLNLALSNNATASPDESVSMGGGAGMFGGRGDAATDGTAKTDTDSTTETDTTKTDTAAKSAVSSTSFESRFLASATFKKLYDAAYQDLYTQLLADGTAQTLLTDITASIPASDGLTADDIAKESATLKEFLDQRSAALKEDLAS